MSAELKEVKALLQDIKRSGQRLEDREAVKELIVDYARGCDRGNDPEMIGPLFTEDGVWECAGFGRYETREGLVAGLKGIAGEKIWWSLHYMISPKIALANDGQSGTAFWYLWESATLPNAASDRPEPHWIGGTYDTEVVKQHGRWRFKAMRLNLTMVSPYAYGWVERLFPAGGTKVPYFQRAETGTHFWCACGRSQRQPYCDGSHKGTDVQPLKFEADEEKLVAYCGCKRTKTPPYCDGTHLNLK